MTELQKNLTVLTTVLTGLAAGALFAFSTFVMPALHRLSTGDAITAMQAINRAAPTPLFLIALFGPLPLCGYLVVTALRRSGTVTVLVVVGVACYAVGTLLTIAYHVPHNDALATIDPNGAGAAQTWQTYYAGWTLWNHVRVAALTAATACFAFAVRVS